MSFVSRCSYHHISFTLFAISDLCCCQIKIPPSIVWGNQLYATVVWVEEKFFIVILNISHKITETPIECCIPSLLLNVITSLDTRIYKLTGSMFIFSCFFEAIKIFDIILYCYKTHTIPIIGLLEQTATL